MSDLDNPKGPESKTEDIPSDVLRKTRFTVIESPADEPPRIHFYERAPEKGGKSIFSVPYSAQNRAAYHAELGGDIRGPKDIPPYSPEEIGERKKGLHTRLDAMYSKLQPELALELNSHIDAYNDPRALNDVEDYILMQEQKSAAEQKQGTGASEALVPPRAEPSQPSASLDREQINKERRERTERSKEEMRAFPKIQIPGVEGPRGSAWFDSTDGSMRIINDDGYVLKVAPGGIHSFGGKENTVIKKWSGSDSGGWVNVSPEEVRAQRDEARAKKAEAEPKPAPTVPDAKLEPQKEPVKKVPGEKDQPKKKRIMPEAIEGVPGVYAEKSMEGITWHQAASGEWILKHPSGAVTFATPEQVASRAEAEKRQQEIAEQLQKTAQTSFEKPPKPPETAKPQVVASPEPQKTMSEEEIRRKKISSPEEIQKQREKIIQELRDRPKKIEKIERFQSERYVQNILLKQALKKQEAAARGVPATEKAAPTAVEHVVEVPVRRKNEQWRTIDPQKYEGVDILPLDDIILDSEKMKLFYELLDHIDQKMMRGADGMHIIGKYLHQKELLTDEEKTFLEYARHEFSKWYTRAETIAKNLKDDFDANRSNNEYNREDILSYAINKRDEFPDWERARHNELGARGPTLWKWLKSFVGL